MKNVIKNDGESAAVPVGGIWGANGAYVEYWRAGFEGKDICATTKGNALAAYGKGIQDREGVTPAGALVAKGDWHAPGMGEVHSHDHSLMIDCRREIDHPDQDYIADDDLAMKVCSALNGLPTGSAAVPAEQITLAVRDVCELDYSGEEHIHDNLLSITVEDLSLILSRHFATQQPTARGEGKA